MIHPAFENSLSEGVLVAGTQRRFRAISAIAGKRLQFCLHHCSMLASTDGDGSCMYLCISCSVSSLALLLELGICDFYLALSWEVLLVNSFRVLHHAAKACFYPFLQVMGFKMRGEISCVPTVLQHSTTATNSANHLKIMQSNTLV